ncbi:hypothetical protein B5M09_006958 [Aphanomyces astaci]|uniref:Anoctamin transmembrane domain-containing protein n=1 Tax=Aphanomyces astaci TaxID=112090 RepID=A0A425DES3_APHAT|nr:hypothetical protein B5M09_006958 [Aphanomyces astaci]
MIDLTPTTSTFTKSSLPYSKSPRHVGAVGTFRYLTPSDLKTSSGKAPYDFAVIAHRSVQQSPKGCWFWPFNTAERLGFRRLCMVSSPLLEDGEDEHRRIVEKLCAQGLSIDIIDGGHSTGELTSDFFILLIRASDEVATAYAKKFRRKLWVDHGGVCDMPQDFMDHAARPITPAERIQIVEYIVDVRAGLSKARDRWIHDMFPVHDNKMTTQLLTNYVAAFPGTLERRNRQFIDSIRHNFGEKVAYYFAFMHFYNKALLPLALLGIAMQILHSAISTTAYMRVLPFWGVGVSVIWSFVFLKAWDRENATMQFAWNAKLHVKQIEYPNPSFHGQDVENPLTGEMTKKQTQSWRRGPIYVLGAMFMLLQTAIMLVLVALWVSIYEMLKDKYKAGGLFTTQWFAILAEGIVFGLFVDVIQWNFVVTNMARLFTTWENYPTEEQHERALIRKLFLMDFLNYYTWFFSLAFVYVVPTLGDALTNVFNTALFHDAPNCCFGPYLKEVGPFAFECSRCPGGDASKLCTPCTGWFTFDVHHVDLSAMFVTPIVVTQLLNIVINTVMPLLSKWRQERLRAAADADAHQRVMDAGSMKILGNLDYDQTYENRCDNRSATVFGNKDQSRYLEYTPAEIETLNQKAREILFESEQAHYDPYNDFHQLTVQYGFTVMFSILWPPMPMACMLINFLKVRTDGYRLCRTLKILLVCMSTGSMEFYSDLCIKDYAFNLDKEGKSLVDFVMGPNFYCLNFTLRLVVIIVLEHLLLAVAYLVMVKIPGVPSRLQAIMDAREHKFKKMLEASEPHLPLDLATSPTIADNLPVPPPTKQRASITKTKSPPKDKTPDSLKRKDSDKAALARQWSD